jgi:hypothetical protein
MASQYLLGSLLGHSPHNAYTSAARHHNTLLAALALTLAIHHDLALDLLHRLLRLFLRLFQPAPISAPLPPISFPLRPPQSATSSPLSAALHALNVAAAGLALVVYAGVFVVLSLVPHSERAYLLRHVVAPVLGPVAEVYLYLLVVYTVARETR